MSKYNEKKMVDEIRLLALDMINNAKSGHPGIVLSAAPMLYTLFANHMVFDLNNPNWCNRDRFVLSAGHGSALLYAVLYATTEDFTIEELKKFRKINSTTPGHPELNIKKRIEATTGALGQGFATSVGMAIAEKYLEEKYNTKKLTLFNYNIYCLCGDGDLMEGVASEAASFAGTQNLDKLIVLYDHNNISLDGKTDLTFKEDVAERFEAYGFEIFEVKNGESVKAISSAIKEAKKIKRPALIIIDTIIGRGSINENSHTVHGKPLDKDDIVKLRESFKMKTGSFEIDVEAKENFRNQIIYFFNIFRTKVVYATFSLNKFNHNTTTFIF